VCKGNLKFLINKFLRPLFANFSLHTKQKIAAANATAINSENKSQITPLPPLGA
jgi:hypothetical protein